MTDVLDRPLHRRMTSQFTFRVDYAAAVRGTCVLDSEETAEKPRVYPAATASTASDEAAGAHREIMSMLPGREVDLTRPDP